MAEVRQLFWRLLKAREQWLAWQRSAAQGTADSPAKATVTMSMSLLAQITLQRLRLELSTEISISCILNVIS